VSVTLSELVDRLRYESGQSPNVAHGVAHRDAQKYLLRRTQEELYTQYDWPNLKLDIVVPLLAGSRFYNFPPDMDFTFINDVYLRDAGQWRKLDYGITPDVRNTWLAFDDYQSWPPTNWQAKGDAPGQFEVFPTPDQPSSLRIVGRKKLLPLINDSDVVTLDPTLIVLYASAEIMAERKSEAAPLKLQKAQAYLTKLRARMSANKTDPFVIGGGSDNPPPRAGIDYIPPGYGSGP
jgi:hypothetical protein